MKKCLFCFKEIQRFVIIDDKRRDLTKREFCLECAPLGTGSPTLVKMKESVTCGYDYKTQKKCAKCSEIKSLDKDFYRKRVNSDGEQIYTVYCKKCLSNISIDGQRNLKNWAMEYKGGKCEKCEYSKCMAALEFHHLDPNEKDYEPAKLFGQNQSKEKIKAEIDKCILVCANCHREIHDEIKKSKYEKDIMSQYARNEYPDNDILLNMMWDKPLREVARELKVSLGALRKKIEKDKLEKPPIGYWDKAKKKERLE